MVVQRVNIVRRTGKTRMILKKSKSKNLVNIGLKKKEEICTGGGKIE